ncbi:MAG: ABC transporter ATP-binding protein [Bacillota bacterium]
MSFFKFCDIQYQFGDQPRRLPVSAELAPGSVLAIQGPSGSGKTTLLKILARLQRCNGGTVWLEGTDWQAISPALWRRQIHYVAQRPVLFQGTFLENLKIPFQLGWLKKYRSFPLTTVKQGMDQLLLTSEMLDQDVRTLSGGECARMALLRAVLFNPTILLLDEPTAALDARSRQTALTFIKEWLQANPHHGLVLVSHNDDLEGFNHLNILYLSDSRS